MENLSSKIAAEKEHIEKTLANLLAGSQKEKKSITELAGLATFLHNIYTGIENILKQILKSENIKVTKSESWHKEVIELSLKNQIIPKELADRLYEYLSFRHFFIHAYGFTLDEEQLEELTKNIPSIWSKFLLAIKDYL